MTKTSFGRRCVVGLCALVLVWAGWCGHARAQSFEETVEFIRHAMPGCTIVHDSSTYNVVKEKVERDRLGVLAFDKEGTLLSAEIELRQLKGGRLSGGGDFTYFECASGACIEFRKNDIKGTISGSLNELGLRCGTDMNRRLVSALNHLGKTYGKKSPF